MKMEFFNYNMWLWVGGDCHWASHQGHGLVLDRLSHLLVYLTRFPKPVAWSMTFRRTLCLKNRRNLGGPLWLLCLWFLFEEVHSPGSNPKDRLWRLNFNDSAWEHQASPSIGRGSQKQLVNLRRWCSAIFLPIYRAHLSSITFLYIGGFTFIVTYKFPQKMSHALFWNMVPLKTLKCFPTKLRRSWEHIIIIKLCTLKI